MMSNATADEVPSAVPLEAEAAFRAALLDALHGLALGDRNLVRLHYGHRRSLVELAAMFSTQPAAIARQLARICERLLRDIRRGLAARLARPRREIDALMTLARGCLELAIASVLRAN